MKKDIFYFGFIAFCVAWISLIGYLAFAAEYQGWHVSPTGNYRVIRGTPWEVQNVWNSRSNLNMEVASFSDWKKKEIWYTTEASLRYEKWVVASYKNLREGARIDRRKHCSGRPFWNW